MFYHAYNGYLQHAYPHDELKPLTCAGQDTWGGYSLTLVDALDTLLILGNETEFKRASDLVVEQLGVNRNINVSVFETNIRIIGGLLSAHMLSSRSRAMTLPDGWPCSGPLLDLAEKFAQRLLPAFSTNTGMPYGTLRYGVNYFETPITCTAGIGTFVLEFGTLSRLTGNPIYERVSLRALDALWNSRSKLSLVGNHIDVQTGIYTATDAGIGAGVDSYFEYLAKGALLFQRPKLMRQFNEFETAINKHLRRDDWFLWVDKDKATVSMPIFQSLEAFWPGLLTLVGRVEDAARIMASYGQILRHLGLPPEFYNLPNREPVNGRMAYPLRPEIPESLLYLHRATNDPSYLIMAASIVDTIDGIARTKCGFGTVHDVGTGSVEDRMESFFLAETTKYLYLIFDEHNFMHNVGSARAKLVETTGGPCIIEAGGWIFNTEAHPLDPGIVYCCSKKHQSDTGLLQQFEDNVDFIKLMDGHFEDLEQEQEGEEPTLNYTEQAAESEQIANNESPQDDAITNGSGGKNGKEEQTPRRFKPEYIAKLSRAVLETLSNMKEENLKLNIGEDEDEPRKKGDQINWNSLLKWQKLQQFIEEMKKDLAEEMEANVEDLSDNWGLICDKCCTRMDEPDLKTTSREFWRTIYTNYFRFIPKFGRYQCLPTEEKVDWQDIGTHYFNNSPDVATLPSEHQHLDAIKRYSLLKSTWIRHRKEAEDGEEEEEGGFTLLTTPNQPFDINFMGQSKLSIEQIRTLAKQTHFTEKEIRQWYRGFRRDCPNGMLTEVGFQKIYKQFFPQGDPIDFSIYVFKVYDENQDGAIEFDQFVHGLSITGRGSLEQKLAWLFGLYDGDKDGAITRQEMECLITHIYKLAGDASRTPDTEAVPEKRVGTIWTKLNKESDATLTSAEFEEDAKTDSTIVNVLSLYEGLGK
uniref:alpha-1,2-Mannosidase n=1 Tax=Globodera pallida TaxID=36090 RepID=A0A183BZA2_GLOPA